LDQGEQKELEFKLSVMENSKKFEMDHALSVEYTLAKNAMEGKTFEND